MLAYFIRAIFSCVQSFLDSKVFLITLRRKWETKEKKHSQCFPKLTIFKRLSLNSILDEAFFVFCAIGVWFSMAHENGLLQHGRFERSCFGFQCPSVCYKTCEQLATWALEVFRNFRFRIIILLKKKKTYMLRVRLPKTPGTLAGTKIEFTREKSDFF